MTDAQIQAFLNQVDDDLKQFDGAEFCAARLTSIISRLHEAGKSSDSKAAELLRDVRHFANLAKLGRRYATVVRNPSAESCIMILADEAQKKR
jgi:hypothetical protein